MVWNAKNWLFLEYKILTDCNFSNIDEYGYTWHFQTSVELLLHYNGRKVSKTTNIENGKETVLTYENDVLVKKTVNGRPQAIWSCGPNYFLSFDYIVYPGVYNICRGLYNKDKFELLWHVR